MLPGKAIVIAKYYGAVVCALTSLRDTDAHLLLGHMAYTVTANTQMSAAHQNEIPFI